MTNVHGLLRDIATRDEAIVHELLIDIAAVDEAIVYDLLEDIATGDGAIVHDLPRRFSRFCCDPLVSSRCFNMCLNN